MFENSPPHCLIYWINGHITCRILVIFPLSNKIRLCQLIFSADIKDFTSTIFNPPTSYPWHIPDLFILSVLPPHRKLNNSVFNSFNKLSGSGRLNSKWVISERTKDFITVILPKGARFLLDQAFKTFFISFSLFSKFIGTISCKLAENRTPKTLNIAGLQLRPTSGINFTCEFLRDPIQTATVLSILIIRPDIEAKRCKVCTHEQNGSILSSRKHIRISEGRWSTLEFVSSSDPLEDLVFPELISDRVELFPVLGLYYYPYRIFFLLLYIWAEKTSDR